MDEREENLRDAMKDEDAFPDPPCGHLNCDPEGRGWKCLDCGHHLTQERMVAIIKAYKRESTPDPSLLLSNAPLRQTSRALAPAELGNPIYDEDGSPDG